MESDTSAYGTVGFLLFVLAQRYYHCITEALRNDSLLPTSTNSVDNSSASASSPTMLVGHLAPVSWLVEGCLLRLFPAPYACLQSISKYLDQRYRMKHNGDSFAEETMPFQLAFTSI